MSCMSYLEQSYLSTCRAVEILSGKCDNICVPIHHTSDYDLIVDAKGIISRVKVIPTECLAEIGAYIVNLRSAGKEGKQAFCPTDCDFVFVDCPEGYYLIPVTSITQK